MIELKTHITAKALIKESALQGRGLFAKERIETGETVIRWGGLYMNGRELAVHGGCGNLVMQWDDDLYSVEDRGTDDGYFINHSCDSDLWMEGAYTLVAKKKIESGAEITVDYALWEVDPNYVSTWKCRCGKKECRGLVTGNDYKRKDLQARYAGHFSPLVNKILKKF